MFQNQPHLVISRGMAKTTKKVPVKKHKKRRVVSKKPAAPKTNITQTTTDTTAVVKKKRGRPRKNPVPEAQAVTSPQQQEEQPKKKEKPSFLTKTEEVILVGRRWNPGDLVQTAPFCVVGEFGLHYGKVVDHPPTSNFVRVRWHDGSSQCHHTSTIVPSDGRGQEAKSTTKEEILEELRLIAELEKEGI